jgi:hypothetical protein
MSSTQASDDPDNQMQRIINFINSIHPAQRIDLINTLSNSTSTHTNTADIIQSFLDSLPLKVKLMIHHQFPGIGLAFPLCYYSNSILCYLSPDR